MDFCGLWKQGYQLLVGADVCYSVNALGPLFRAASALLAPSSDAFFLLAYVSRLALPSFWALVPLFWALLFLVTKNARLAKKTRCCSPALLFHLLRVFNVSSSLLFWLAGQTQRGFPQIFALFMLSLSSLPSLSRAMAMLPTDHCCRPRHAICPRLHCR